MVRLKKLPNTSPLFGLCSFLYLSFRDFGCDKAIPISPSATLSPFVSLREADAGLRRLDV